VAYLQDSELPSLDGYQGGFTGRDNPGAAWWIGDHEYAIRAAYRERGAFTGLANWAFPLEVVTNVRLGQAHHSLGLYVQAKDFLGKNLELLGDDLLHDTCGMVGLPAVFSRAWLALCLAERGEFSEALALGEDAVRIAETADPGVSLVVGSAG